MGHISGHFRSIQIFDFFKFCFFYKMAPVAILDVRNSLSMAFLAISLIFDKMTILDVRKIIFDRISGHFRSVRNFFFLIFFDKMSMIELVRDIWMTNAGCQV